MRFAEDIKGIIFDCDGVLLDSLMIWEDLGARYLRSKGKVPEEGLAETLFSMNCQRPVAPTRETALGLRADSMTGRYLSSRGIP